MRQVKSPNKSLDFLLMAGEEGFDLRAAGPEFPYLKHSFKSEKFPCELPPAVLTPNARPP